MEPRNSKIDGVQFQAPPVDRVTNVWLQDGGRGEKQWHETGRVFGWQTARRRNTNVRAPPLSRPSLSSPAHDVSPSCSVAETMPSGSGTELCPNATLDPHPLEGSEVSHQSLVLRGQEKAVKGSRLGGVGHNIKAL